MNPFDRTVSTRLDCLIWLLEHEPHRVIRWLLRAYKSAVEGQVAR
jgi:hypothetical protein